MLSSAKPGDQFDVQMPSAGTFVLTLTPVSQVPRGEVRLVKQGGYTVGVLDRPIDPAALADALAEFP